MCKIFTINFIKHSVQKEKDIQSEKERERNKFSQCKNCSFYRGEKWVTDLSSVDVYFFRFVVVFTLLFFVIFLARLLASFTYMILILFIFIYFYFLCKVAGQKFSF